MMRGRCVQHQIALGPKGCVLCRREQVSCGTAARNEVAPSEAVSKEERPDTSAISHASSAPRAAAAAPAPPTASEARPSASTLERAPRRLDIQVPLAVLWVPLLVLGVYFIAAATGRSSPTAEPGVAATAEPRTVSAQNLSAQNLSAQNSNGGTPSPSALVGGTASRGTDAESPSAAAGSAMRSQPVAARTDAAVRASERSARQAGQARELAAAREDVEVSVYFAEWCPACRAVRQYLGQRGIRSVEYDVEKDQRAASRYRVLNPRKTIPTLDIEGQILVGFDPQSIQSAIDRAARSRLARLDSGF
jgi:glutaredoxin